MRNLILVCLALPFFLISCQEEGRKSVEELTVQAERDAGVRVAYNEKGERDTTILGKFEWVETSYDFGELVEGDVVKHTFKFKNVGNAPLTITRAAGSCGCTVADHTKKPVPVGEEGEVNVEFNSTNKGKNEVKEVTIVANTYPKSTTILKIRANVNKKEK